MSNYPTFITLPVSKRLMTVLFRGLAIGASILLLLATKMHPNLGAGLRVVTYPNNSCVKNASNLTSFHIHQLPFYCAKSYYVNLGSA